MYPNMNWLARTKEDGRIHLIDPNNPDHDALCGADITKKVYLSKSDKLNCPECERILRFCKGVPKYIFGKNGS